MDSSSNPSQGAPSGASRRAYIGLGANLGDAFGALAHAVEQLGGLGEVAAVSPVYETEPVGYTDQPPFTNAVAAVDTALSPEDLLAALQAIEAGRGRKRTIRWGPRTLDLDLLWYEGEERDTDDLVLPHPRVHEREFVLRPLADIAPALPLAGSTVAELLDAVPDQGVRMTDRRLMPG
jgi:2-amino-4-hydroxy-6-hydroxymethyldihydropteridine diphosphokinase